VSRAVVFPLGSHRGAPTIWCPMLPSVSVHCGPALPGYLDPRGM
jgi:hypothetical protein